CAPTFPSLRAAHYSWLFRLVNTFFQGRRTEVDVVADAASSCDPKAFSPKRAAYYVRLFVSVNTFVGRMLMPLWRGVHRGEDRVAARERILKTSANSSRLLSIFFIAASSLRAARHTARQHARCACCRRLANNASLVVGGACDVGG
ncbi:hypothetical protein, partial [Stenotrophomonas rhizophila]|uniref:hypothetical protein n=1 Tax=Stenotrophomonas rhizophila TaxID=216778 RepID=UPI001E6016E2